MQAGTGTKTCLFNYLLTYLFLSFLIPLILYLIHWVFSSGS